MIKIIVVFLAIIAIAYAKPVPCKPRHINGVYKELYG